jgi:hypothetical protein
MLPAISVTERAAVEASSPACCTTLVATRFARVTGDCLRAPPERPPLLRAVEVRWATERFTVEARFEALRFIAPRFAAVLRFVDAPRFAVLRFAPPRFVALPVALRAPDFRAVDFRALDFRALDFPAALRADAPREPDRAAPEEERFDEERFDEERFEDARLDEPDFRERELLPDDFDRVAIGTDLGSGFVRWRTQESRTGRRVRRPRASRRARRGGARRRADIAIAWRNAIARATPTHPRRRPDARAGITPVAMHVTRGASSDAPWQGELRRRAGASRTRATSSRGSLAVPQPDEYRLASSETEAG